MKYRPFIPACAGSTDPAITSANRPWDHPRIRGVHLGHQERSKYCRGSSPHTRGTLPDGNHGTGNDYIELFAAIRDGQEIRRLRIVAKEKGVAGNFDIEDAQYYDVIVEKDAIATHLPNGSNSRKTPSNLITIADLLNGVNDKSGVPYLNSNGELKDHPHIRGVHG